MSELLRIAMPAGGAIWAQVELGEIRADELEEIEIYETVQVPAEDLDEPGGITDVGARRLFQKVKKLTDFKETIETVALSIHEGFADLPKEKIPDKVSVEFAIEIAGKSGRLVGVLAELGGKAAIKVNVEWDEMAARIGGN